ncbi:hypothetical protein [Anaerofustis stercorihominis]|uniref:HEAT repeat protein n=2 Tax=Anaerofustis stercorihominis TaxID=214853 RepID=B1CB91_9FIRM|nr:hypothetical protein [Anaerofustis stercorihominis]EDS71538.1 hypothetical protein ANASTE_01240 [Anaerofustis stercorihominis DSM 17244]
MNRFTLIVLTAILMILLIVILYFSLSTLFAKIKNAIFNIKIKKFIIAVTESFDNLSHGKFPQSETIEFICLNINKDKAMKDLFYKKAEEVLTDTDHETITRKFMDEINNKINQNVSFIYEDSYSDDLNDLITITASYDIKDEKANEFLLNCLKSNSKRIRTHAFSVISLRGDINTFAKAVVITCDKLADYSFEEIKTALNKFKDRKILLPVLKRLKDETDNIKLKLTLRDYLES